MEQIQIKDLKKHVEKVERRLLRLYEKAWNEERGSEKWVYGTRIDNKELLDLVTRMLRIIHHNPEIYVEFIAVTKDGIFVQWRTEIYNNYGSYVGTEYSYEELGRVISKFKEIESELPDEKELLEKIQNTINDLLEKLKNNVERVERMRIRLYQQNWLDNYNGRPGRALYVYGVKISYKDNAELIGLLTRLLQIIHDNPQKSVDFVAITKDKVYIQYHTNVINPYGIVVGTEHCYDDLDSVINKFKMIESELPDEKELLKKFKEVVNNILE
ncbi:MAG: hypothetical protein QXK24_07650 [Ignisphaera sp.]